MTIESCCKSHPPRRETGQGHSPPGWAYGSPEDAARRIGEKGNNKAQCTGLKKPYCLLDDKLCGFKKPMEEMG